MKIEIAPLNIYMGGVKLNLRRKLKSKIKKKNTKAFEKLSLQLIALKFYQEKKSS